MKKLNLPYEGWLRTAVLILWTIELLALLNSDKYTSFLRPEFGIMLGAGVLFLSGFVICGFFHIGSSRPISFNSTIRSLIIILPLVYIHNTDSAGLDRFAFSNRSTGLPVVSTGNQADSPDQTAPDPEYAYNSNSGECRPTEENTEENRDKTGDKELTIKDLYENPDKYAGEKVTVIGMVASDKELEEEFGESARFLFRFVITCCAADATPLSIVMPDSSRFKAEDDEWVSATGTFEIITRQQGSIPMLKETVIKEIKTPSSPYLY